MRSKFIPRACANCANCGEPTKQKRKYCSLACYHRHQTLPPAERFWRHVRRTDDLFSCWEWQASRNERGYGQFAPQCGRPILAHRYSWELAYGPIPAGLFVCHDCPGGDNPACVRPEHLFLGTHQDNMRDAKEKGWKAIGARNGVNLHPECRAVGERSGTAKLTEAQVREIRRRHQPHVPRSRAALAQEFGVHPVYIGDIVARRRWKHLD